jgi:hypothetical protein
MSEFNPVYEPVQSVDGQMNIGLRRRMAVAGLTIASLVGVGACMNDGGEVETPQESSTSYSDSFLDSRFDSECLALDLSDNLADTNYVKPEGFLPGLTETKEGKEQLITDADAKDKIRQQICGDTRALATLDAVLELRERKQLPDQDLLGRIEKLIELYNTNDDAAVRAERRVFESLEFLTAEPNFAVTKGQATEIQAVRDEDNKMTGMKAVTVNTTGTFQGFIIEFNRDDAVLSSADIALLDKLSMLVLIEKDGTVVINNLALTGGFEIDTEREQDIPVDVIEDEDAEHKEEQDKEDQQNGDGGGNTGTTGTNGGNGGNTGTTNGDGGGNTGTTGGGNGGGTSTTTGGNGGGTTTTGPGSTTTSGPATTTTTRPTTTTQPPTTTTTPTPTTKGPDPGCPPEAPIWACED